MDQYQTQKRGKTYEELWIFPNGSMFDIMSYEQAQERFESADRDWIVFDEPCPRDKFIASVSRLREGGLVLMGSTPLGKLAWVESDLMEEENVRWVVASKEDNCKKHGIRGQREHFMIENAMSLLDPDEKEARAFGRFMHLTGRIYKDFSKVYNVIDDMPLKDIIQHQPCAVLNVLDPHDRKPFVFIWALVTADLDVIIIKEFPFEIYHRMKSSSYSIKDYVYVLKDIESNIKNGNAVLPIKMRVVDPFYGNRRRVGVSDNTTIKEELAGFDYHYIDGNTDVNFNRLKVKELLRFDKEKEVNHFNRPKFFVFKSCINTIYGMTHHRYAEEKNPDKELSEKGADTKAKCFANCVEYLATSNYNYLIEEPQSFMANYHNRRKGY